MREVVRAVESGGYTVKWIASSVGEKFFKASKGSGEKCWLVEEVTEHQGVRKAGGAVTFAWSVGEIQHWIHEQTKFGADVDGAMAA